MLEVAVKRYYLARANLNVRAEVPYYTILIILITELTHFKYLFQPRRAATYFH